MKCLYVIAQGDAVKWTDLRNLLDPVYVGEPVGPPSRFRNPPYVPEAIRAQEDKYSPEEKKAKTRIPVSRFKTAVSKVQRERKYSEDTNDPKDKKEVPEKPPRGSSIPKLSDRILAARKNTYKTGANEQTVKNNNKEPVKEEAIDDQLAAKATEKKPAKIDRIPVIRRDPNRERETQVKNENKPDNAETNEDQTTIQLSETASTAVESNDLLDDEFDKLYEEIIDTEAESIPDEILNAKVKDPEKLDSKFEEIVHQYDEETIEQVKVELVDKARYSKIPLLKRRSEHDIKVPKHYERRLSLKTGLNKIAKTNAEHQANDDNIKTSVGTKINDDDVFEAEKSVYILGDNTQREEIEIISNENITLAPRSPVPTPAYNIIATPDAELVKIGLSNFDIAIERNLASRNIECSDGNDIATPEPETVKVSILDISTKAHAVPVESDPDLELGEVTMIGYLVEEPVSINEPLNIENVILIDEPEALEVSEASLIVTDDIIRRDVDDEVKNEEVDTKDIFEAPIIDFELAKPDDVWNSQKYDIIPVTDSEFKSVNLLRSTFGLEESNKSRYINKPIDNEIQNNNIIFIEEDVPILKVKVSSIRKRLTSLDNNDIANSDLNINSDNEIKVPEILEQDDVPLKGNVNKIINRMTSQDIDHNVKKEIDEIPKKKSVLSRIAMFERPAQEPVFPKKPTQRFSKPKRTISEEIRHSPKIVQEVLKPHMKNGKTHKPYEVVTIDIIQPLEVVTNNEEQILVIEDLKEDTVDFENLDNHRLLEISTNANIEEITVDQNETQSGNFDTDVRLYEFATQEYEPESMKVAEQNKAPVFETIDNRPKVVDNRQSREAVKDYIPVKEKIKRLKSHEDTNMRRAKSTAELDIGDAVKGKVKNIIVRMNSMDFLDDRDNLLGEKEKISVKERPRKRSVSEKIAMFEKKLTPVKMDDVKVDTGRALNIDLKPAKDINSVNSVNSVNSPTKPAVDVVNSPPKTVDSVNVTVDDEEYNVKIRELMNAKMTYGSVDNMSYVPLRDGNKMPVLALGTALLDPRLTKHIVSAAIDLGFRAIDTAFIYGTEKEVGEGIRAKIQDGTVKREELFIMSKLWSTYHKPELVEKACRASLNATGLDYFDLYMIHNPMSFKEGNDPLPKIANVLQFSSHEYLDAWFAMEDLVAKGLVKSVGVSNFNSEQVARVVEKGRLKPVVNQVECHPYLSQQRLSDFCDARDVKLSCFGTLGSKGTPAELKASQAAAIDDPLVQVMAAGLGISPAQLLIRYQISCGHSVVVKASSAAHQWDVLRALGGGASLAPAQLAALHALNTNKRAFTFKGMGDTHRNYPFKIPF